VVHSVGEGYPAWLNHLETFHGNRYTPYFRLNTRTPAKYPCPFPNCASKSKGKNFNYQGLVGHFARGRGHGQDATAKGKFKSAIRCPECLSQENRDGTAPSIESIWDWKQHWDSVHNDKQRRQCTSASCVWNSSVLLGAPSRTSTTYMNEERVSLQILSHV
jgi:hypothetical protein